MPFYYSNELLEALAGERPDLFVVFQETTYTETTKTTSVVFYDRNKTAYVQWLVEEPVGGPYSATLPKEVKLEVVYEFFEATVRRVWLAKKPSRYEFVAHAKQSIDKIMDLILRS